LSQEFVLMSVLPSDICFFGSASMPDVDGATTGGALATSILINFNDISPNGTMNYVSSSASDTATIVTLSVRDATGVIQSEAKTLTGVTPVTGTQVCERLMKGVVSGTTATGDVAAISATAVVTGTAQAGVAASASASATITLASGAGASCTIGMIVRITNNLPAGVTNQIRRIVAISGDVISVNRDWGTVPTNATTYGVYHGMLFDILPNQVTQNRRPFYNVASDVTGGANRNYYEKIFAVNTNTGTALTVASIIKQTDPSSGSIQFALTNSLNDTATVANRQTAPATGITAFSSGAAPQTINVPSPQNLPSGTAPNAAGAQGIWLNLALTAGLAAAKTSFTLRATGTTT
jgi:hypothetical protein